MAQTNNNFLTFTPAQEAEAEAAPVAAVILLFRCAPASVKLFSALTFPV